MDKRRKILVVDDEKLVCDSCSSILSEEGFDVETIMSPRDGLRRVQEETFDLLLADLRMPDIDGIELMENVRASHSDLAIVVITGYPSVETAVRSTQLGAMEYLAKPFTPDELTSAVDRALEKYEDAAGGQSGPSVVTGNVVEAAIDTVRAMPEELGEHRGKVAPRAGILTVDLDQCAACLTCEVECGLAHCSTPDGSTPSLFDMFKNARVQVEAVGRDPVPMRCKQCEDPPCARACPAGAIRKLGPTLPVVIDNDRCIGCKNCVLACPFGCVFVSGTSNMVIKCDHCYDMLRQDEDPICVRSCPTGALKFVPIEDMGGEARQRAAREMMDAVKAEPEQTFDS